MLIKGIAVEVSEAVEALKQAKCSSQSLLHPGNWDARRHVRESGWPELEVRHVTCSQVSDHQGHQREQRAR